MLGLIVQVNQPRTFANREQSGKEIVPNAFDTREATDQVRIHLVAAKMWAGKILEGLGDPFPAELADRAE